MRNATSTPQLRSRTFWRTRASERRYDGHILGVARTVAAALGPILVYGAFPNIATTAETPIELQVAGAPPIATQPTAVPNPLPSPAATASAAPLAVSVPALAAATTYQVYARQTIGGCVTPHNVETNVGSFTTK